MSTYVNNRMQRRRVTIGETHVYSAKRVLSLTFYCEIIGLRNHHPLSIMVVYLQSLQILSDLMLKVYLKICLKHTPVSAYTVHSTGLSLMSLKSVVILSHKICWQGLVSTLYWHKCKCRIGLIRSRWGIPVFVVYINSVDWGILCVGIGCPK